MLGSGTNGCLVLSGNLPDLGRSWRRFRPCLALATG